MIASVWNFITTAGAFVVALGLLVTVHEFGHFWIARRNGVLVRRFCVGFGKVIYSRYDRHGTEFAIAAIPLGGYVKMLDERVEDVPPELKDQSFNAKTVLQRMAIIFAGPAANLIFAVFILWLTFMMGQVERKPIIGKVEPGSIFAKAGLEPGMQILSVNGNKTLDWSSVGLALMSTIGDDKVTVEVVGHQSKQHSTHVLDIKGEELDNPDQPLFTTMGFMPNMPEIKTEISVVNKGSAGQRAGLEVGDKIVAVNDRREPTWQQVVDVIKQSPGVAVDFEIERNGSRINLEVIPDSRERQGRNEGFVGIAPVFEPLKEDELVTIEYGPMEAFSQGVTKTGELIRQSFVMLGKFVTADISLRNLSGPVSIARGASYSAEAGLVKFLVFLALLSVNLGVINLVPLPILDGGHLFYYTIELIRGKSVSERAQQIGFAFGAVILFLLMGISILNDISRL